MASLQELETSLYRQRVQREQHTDLNSHVEGRAATLQNFAHCLKTCPLLWPLAGWSAHLGHGGAWGRAFLIARDRM